MESELKIESCQASSSTAHNSNSTPEIETLATNTLSMQVDCVGWNRKHNLLAVGGYELSKNDSSVRTGILYLITCNLNLPNGSCVIQEEPSTGILDLKWEQTEENRLVVATSNSILVYHLNLDDSELFSLELLFDYFLELKSSIMALYVEWMQPDRIIYCDSTGCINMLAIIGSNTDHSETDTEKSEQSGVDVDVEEQLELALVNHVQLHDNIIWVVHYDSTSQIIYSGADDGTFTAFHQKNFSKKDTHLIKRFAVGVTSINTKDDIVAVGCYDDILRIYTFEMADESERKVMLNHCTEINLGGAVWRTVWIPKMPLSENKQDNGNGVVEDTEYKIGVAAARNGIHMITLKRPSWTWEKNLSCLDYKENLAYGIDVMENVEDKTYTVATCYFDNHVLHVWKIKAF